MYNSEQEYLANYNEDAYRHPSVTVDMLIFAINRQKNKNYRALCKKSLQVLLIKRRDYPSKDKWAVPGGFVEMDESLYEAACRELKEETSLENVYMEQLYTWGDVNRDPRTRVISVSYMAIANKSDLSPKANDDAAEAEWFDIQYYKSSDDEEGNTYILSLSGENGTTLKAKIKEVCIEHGNVLHKSYEIVDSGEIAFDHAKILAYSLERLKAKVEWSDIAFHLMPREFTLGDLQDVYSIILGKTFQATNFRRKIKHMIIPLGKKSSDSFGHRPSELYSFNKDWFLTKNY